MKVMTIDDVDTRIDEGQAYPYLEPSKEYVVLGIDDKCYRIVNELQEPLLYPKHLFFVVDPNVPQHWVRVDGRDGDYYIDPPEFSDPAFYEDLFNMKSYAIKRYQRFLKLNGLNL